MDAARVESGVADIRTAAAGIRARAFDADALVHGLLVVRLPRGLPGERRAVSGAELERRARPPLVAITFDFGNTLVPVDRAALEAVVDAAGRRRRGPVRRVDRDGVPRGVGARSAPASSARRCRASARSTSPCACGASWPACAGCRRRRRTSPGTTRPPRRGPPRPRSTSASTSTAGPSWPAIPPDPGVGALLARLAPRYRLGILSNWPLAATIDRYAEAAGWTPHLAAIVVSERVGTIKPHPAIFRAAEAALAGPGAPPLAPGSILHVGDDWAADVVGAHARLAGGYLRFGPPIAAPRQPPTIAPSLTSCRPPPTSRRRLVAAASAAVLRPPSADLPAGERLGTRGRQARRARPARAR